MASDRSLTTFFAVDAVKVPVQGVLARSRDLRYVYVCYGDAKVELYYASECVGAHATRNLQMEWAHTHGMPSFRKLTLSEKPSTPVKTVRVLAVDVVCSMLKASQRDLARPADGRVVDMHSVVDALSRRYKNAETTGPESPLTHISYDTKARQFVWTRTKTPYLWHMQVGDAAFSNFTRGIRALRSGHVDGGAKPDAISARIDLLKLPAAVGKISNLKLLLADAQVRMRDAPTATTEPEVVAPPPRPVSQPQPSEPAPRPTTGGKGLVTSGGPTPTLSKSATFWADAITESPSSSEASDASSDDAGEEPTKRPDAAEPDVDDDEDPMSMDACDGDSDYDSGYDSMLEVLPLRMPLSDKEPVVGLKHAADEVCQNYRRMMHVEGRLGGGPDRSRDEDDRALATGLAAQITMLGESIQDTDAQIAGLVRMIALLKRKREVAHEIYGELHEQLRLAKKRCALPTDAYVLERAQELKRMRREAARSKAAPKTVDIL